MNPKKPTNSTPKSQEYQSDNDEAIDDQEIELLESSSSQEAESQQQSANEQLNEETDILELLQEIEQLKPQIAKAQDQQLRAQAEVENIRRRAAIDQTNARKYAVEGFAEELLMVRDSLNLAQKVDLAADNENAIKNMQEGLNLTLKQLDHVFSKFSISVICPEVGDKLDPQFHQAMSMQPSDEVANNCILSVVQNGYKLHDRLLRPAMVIVAKSDS